MTSDELRDRSASCGSPWTAKDMVAAADEIDRLNQDFQTLSYAASELLRHCDEDTWSLRIKGHFSFGIQRFTEQLRNAIAPGGGKRFTEELCERFSENEKSIQKAWERDAKIMREAIKERDLLAARVKELEAGISPR